MDETPSRHLPSPGLTSQGAKTFADDRLGAPSFETMDRLGRAVTARLTQGISPHALYAGLGRTPAARQRAYRQLFEFDLDPAVTARLRHATRTGTALGSESFLVELAAAAGRRVRPRGHGGDRRSQRFVERGGR